MLTRIDRLQVAVPDRKKPAKSWTALFGAEHERNDLVGVLGAKRSVYRLGDGWIELLEPDGIGPVADAVAKRGGHFFAGGAATAEFAKLMSHMQERNVAFAIERGQAFLDSMATGGHGMRLVISQDRPQPPVGNVDTLYEITNLVHDTQAAVANYADLLGLAQAAFKPIESPFYGYQGVLTLFSPDRLDRFEVITPHAPSNTMGRFFARNGECLYMAFAEAADLGGIEARASELGVACTAVPPRNEDQQHDPAVVFLHPQALGGIMLGVSKRSHAWLWSGHPDRVRSET